MDNLRTRTDCEEEEAKQQAFGPVVVLELLQSLERGLPRPLVSPVIEARSWERLHHGEEGMPFSAVVCCICTV